MCERGSEGATEGGCGEKSVFLVQHEAVKPLLNYIVHDIYMTTYKYCIMEHDYLISMCRL